MDWQLTKDIKPTVGKWVLVWDRAKQIAFVGKWDGKCWKAVCNNTTAEKGSHWCVLVGPEGEVSRPPSYGHQFTKRDTQHS